MVNAQERPKKARNLRESKRGATIGIASSEEKNVDGSPWGGRITHPGHGSSSRG